MWGQDAQYREYDGTGVGTRKQRWAWREERKVMRGKCKGKRENYNPFTRLPRTNCLKPPSFHLFPDRDFSQNNGVGRKRNRLERLKPIATRGESEKKSSRVVASALWKKRPKVPGPNVSFLPFLSLLQALGELQWEIEWTDTLRHCHSLSFWQVV